MYVKFPGFVAVALNLDWNSNDLCDYLNFINHTLYQVI